MRRLYFSTDLEKLTLNCLLSRNLRQVPDTQEVLLSPNSDVSYILEILRSVDAEDLSEAIRWVRP